MSLGTCQWHKQPLNIYSITGKKLLCSQCTADHQSLKVIMNDDLIDACRKTAAIMKEKVKKLTEDEREIKQKIQSDPKLKGNVQIVELLDKMDRFMNEWLGSNDVRIMNGDFSQATLSELQSYRFYEPNREYISQVIEKKLKFRLDCLNQLNTLIKKNQQNGVIFIDDDESIDISASKIDISGKIDTPAVQIDIPTGQQSIKAFEQAQTNLRKIMDRQVPDRNNEQQQLQQRRRQELMNQKYNQCLEELRQVTVHISKKQYQVALDILDSHSYPRELKAIAQTIKAKLLILSSQFKKASEVLESHPKKSDKTVFLQAYAQYKESNYDKCLNIVKSTINESDDTQMLRADAYYHKNQLDNSRNCYMLALKQNPNNKMVDSRIARIDIKEGRFSEAQRKLQRSIKDNPNNSQLCNDMAYVLLHQSKTEMARTHLLRADKDSVACAINKASVEYLQGNTNMAKKILEENKKNCDAMTNYIIIVERMKDTPKLFGYMDKFEKQFPDNLAYQERLCSIQINSANPDQIKAAANKLYNMIQRNPQASTVILYAIAVLNIPEMDKKQCMEMLMRFKDSKSASNEQIINIKHLLALFYMQKNDLNPGAWPFINQVYKFQHKKYNVIYNVAQFDYLSKNYVNVHDRLKYVPLTLNELSDDFFRKVAFLKIMTLYKEKKHEELDKYVDTLLKMDKCPIVSELQALKKTLA